MIEETPQIQVHLVANGENKSYKPKNLPVITATGIKINNVFLHQTE